LNEQLRRHIASAALIIGFFVAWEVLCIGFGVKEIVLPRPSQILATLWERAPAIMPHAAQTLYTTLVGFGLGILIGISLGALIGSSRLAYDVAYPLLIGFASIPKVAVVPILVLWFGAGTVPAVLTAMVMCIFPIVVNVATGLATTEPELEDVMRALKASKLDILVNVGLPRTMPYFFASLKVAVTLAFVGTVIAETVASNRGIGNLMMIASSNRRGDYSRLRVADQEIRHQTHIHHRQGRLCHGRAVVVHLLALRSASLPVNRSHSRHHQCHIRDCVRFHDNRSIDPLRSGTPRQGHFLLAGHDSVAGRDGSHRSRCRHPPVSGHRGNATRPGRIPRADP
jgi:NitT/TauT family transport system permease protein